MRNPIRKFTAALLASLLLFIGCEKKMPVGHLGILPPELNDDRDPDWSPDGNTIAFTHTAFSEDTSGGPFGIYFINPEGSNRRLFLLNAHSPDWSPDGKQLAFVLNGQICIINSDSTGFRALDVEGFFPDWSPDGSKIAYDTSEGGSIYFLNVNLGGQPQKYLDNAWEPAWSRDGQYLAFSRNENPFVASSIFIAKVDGTGALQLAKPIEGMDYHYTPCYSRDGSKIAYSSAKRGVIIMENNGANKKIISRSGIHPSWSPDDRHIVFGGSTNIPGRFRLFIINADGTGSRQLTF